MFEIMMWFWSKKWFSPPVLRFKLHDSDSNYTIQVWNIVVGPSSCAHLFSIIVRSATNGSILPTSMKISQCVLLKSRSGFLGFPAVVAAVCCKRSSLNSLKLLSPIARHPRLLRSLNSHHFIIGQTNPPFVVEYEHGTHELHGRSRWEHSGCYSFPRKRVMWHGSIVTLLICVSSTAATMFSHVLSSWTLPSNVEYAFLSLFSTPSFL